MEKRIIINPTKEQFDDIGKTYEILIFLMGKDGLHLACNRILNEVLADMKRKGLTEDKIKDMFTQSITNAIDIAFKQNDLGV